MRQVLVRGPGWTGGLFHDREKQTLQLCLPSLLLLTVTLHCWSHGQVVAVWGSPANHQAASQVALVVQVPLGEKLCIPV